MSRTTRKRYRSFEETMLWIDDTYTKKELGRLKAHWTNNQYYGWSLPKYFRKMVNKTRRRKDTRVLYKEVNMIPHKEEWYSNYNCKDNQAWDYF